MTQETYFGEPLKSPQTAPWPDVNAQFGIAPRSLWATLVPLEGRSLSAPFLMVMIAAFVVMQPSWVQKGFGILGLAAALGLHLVSRYSRLPHETSHTDIVWWRTWWMFLALYLLILCSTSFFRDSSLELIWLVVIVGFLAYQLFTGLRRSRQ